MVAVKERLNRIAKIRRLLGMKYDRVLEAEINTLAMANLSALRQFMSSESFEIVHDVLEKTATQDDNFVITNALSADREVLAYHKAVSHVCRKIMEIFDSKKITEATNEMRSRNEVLTEEVQSRPTSGPHFLNTVRNLEDAR